MAVVAVSAIVVGLVVVAGLVVVVVVDDALESMGQFRLFADSHLIASIREEVVGQECVRD